MSPYPLFDEALLLQTGAVAPDGSLLVVALEQEKYDVGVRHCHLLLRRAGTWSRAVSLDFLCVRVVWFGGCSGAWVALGETGTAITVTSEGSVSEDRLYPQARPGSRGLMRSLCAIGDTLYAVGMRRQVFARSRAGEWTDVQGNLAQWRNDADDVTGFESIGGLSEEAVYAVGWEGEIALRRAQQWQAVPSPTNVILTGIACAPDGSMVACGQRGTLLRRECDAWTALDASVVPEDYWDAHWHEDRLYVASLRSLYMLADSRLRRVDLGDAFATSFHHLSSAGRFLCSVGALAVCLFDGDTWTAVDLP